VTAVIIAGTCIYHTPHLPPVVSNNVCPLSSSTKWSDLFRSHTWHCVCGGHLGASNWWAW